MDLGPLNFRPEIQSGGHAIILLLVEKSKSVAVLKKQIFRIEERSSSDKENLTELSVRHFEQRSVTRETRALNSRLTLDFRFVK